MPLPVETRVKPKLFVELRGLAGGIVRARAHVIPGDDAADVSGLDGPDRLTVLKEHVGAAKTAYTNPHEVLVHRHSLPVLPLRGSDASLPRSGPSPKAYQMLYRGPRAVQGS
jgi:hypothetical protein